eukprot:CAMPEP_0114531728 /NCGR_PEP_ID=MMETSP0109-20121206/26228_1 /TAXON_ID=29199 /ORGANISM="Chlorarachnion reptans, Strain CCCM449" /LENGTH=107 /DNA_ID=CAMNT_0001714627 /DNA_START=352 /DNA_END=675 /DNA_ORIENTATION=-
MPCALTVLRDLVNSIVSPNKQPLHQRTVAYDLDLILTAKWQHFILHSTEKKIVCNLIYGQFDSCFESFLQLFDTEVRYPNVFDQTLLLELHELFESPRDGRHVFYIV